MVLNSSYVNRIIDVLGDHQIFTQQLQLAEVATFVVVGSCAFVNMLMAKKPYLFYFSLS